MPESETSKLSRPLEIIREISNSQGEAVRSYGELLVSFGKAEIGFGDLLKRGGDLYIRQTGSVASSILGASIELAEWGLANAGIRPVKPSVDKKIVVSRKRGA